MKKNLLLTIVSAAIVVLACSPGEQRQPLEASFDFQAEGGNSRVLFSWSGVPEYVDIIRISLGGEFYDIPVTTASGSKSISNVREGNYDGKVSYITSEGKLLEEGTAKVRVYGEEYESALKQAQVSIKSQDAARTVLSITPADGMSSIELSYDSLSEGVLTRNITDEAEITLDNLYGEIWYRTLYIPSTATGDVFATAPDTLKGNFRRRPTPEQICQTVDGYRGIWFDLGQAASSYGSKYSGGLGTYTCKHIPMAKYAPEVDRTYFVYGGTPASNKKYLQCMIGCFDHKTGKLQKPRVVYDKGALGVADPHDDPTVQIDKDGYIWVFVAGRGNTRPGLRYKSINPYDISAFEYINESIMAYPQVMYHPDKGFFLFFTRYDGTRQLFYQKSTDGVTWTKYKQLASIKEPGDKNSGHYQISNMYGTKLCTAFNRHKNGNVDTRTNFYFLQSTDWGESWTTVNGEPVTTPVTTLNSNCLVHDYQSEGRNCYIKDVNFDTQGNPVVIMVTSDNHLTGPSGGIREWHVWYWDGFKWNDTLVTTSTHCYDSGSIWVEGDEWTIIGPTEAGPQYWGTGGEVVMWKSFDKGKTWTRQLQMTSGSVNNHSYMRRPWGCADGFYSFWADGNPDKFTQSYLYFCNKSGKVFRMPYEFTDEWVFPEEMNFQ